MNQCSSGQTGHFYLKITITQIIADMLVLATLISLCLGGSELTKADDHLSVWYDRPIEISVPQGVSTVQAKINYSGAKGAAKDSQSKDNLRQYVRKGEKARELQGSVWENYAFPMGNSSLGAMVLQSPAVDAILLNEKSLWKGGPASGSGPANYWRADPHSARFLPDIRQAFLDGDSLRADSLTRRAFSGAIADNGTADTLRFGTFTTMGEMYVSTGIANEDCSDFRRSLLLDKAVSHTSFKYQGATYRRTYFVSYPDQLMVMHYGANHGQRQNLDWVYKPNPHATGTWATDEYGLVYTAHLNNNKLPYVIRIQARVKDGSVKYEDGHIAVRDASEVDFIITAATGYKPNYSPVLTDPYTYYGKDAGAWALLSMKGAADKKWGQLLRRHVDDYTQLFDRVSIDLRQMADKKGGNDIPTDERIDRYREGKADAWLEMLYYQFARYLIIQSSRGETMPMNLQGMWNRGVKGPWNCDYHNNINIQMNYWPVCSANLAECFEPLNVYLRSIYEPGQRTAKTMYDARGWTANISTNIFGFTAPSKSESVNWNLAAINGPWLATHVWDYYEYTLDRDYLKQTAYPLLKSSAQFVCDYLWLQPSGLYTAAPSTSPEHGPVDKGATFANAVARQLLTDAISASRVLGVDSTDRQEWLQVRDKIEPYRIGRYGQLMEWSRDIDNPKDNHRHTNHLFGLFPSHDISVKATPELAEAARVVLDHRGDFSTGWSMGWKLNLWAHLRDGNRSYALLQNLLRTGTLYNLWDTHPPYQIDGNLGGLSGMNEMLLQSEGRTITLLPACPQAWDKGSVKGLRARGNVTVDIDWTLSANSLAATLSSPTGGTFDIVFGDRQQTVQLPQGKKVSVKF